MSEKWCAEWKEDYYTTPVFDVKRSSFPRQYQNTILDQNLRVQLGSSTGPPQEKNETFDTLNCVLFIAFPFPEAPSLASNFANRRILLAKQIKGLPRAT